MKIPIDLGSGTSPQKISFEIVNQLQLVYRLNSEKSSMFREPLIKASIPYHYFLQDSE